MTYLLLAGGLLFLVILAVRSFRRYREEQAAQLTELRRAAERHGWNCVIAPTLDVIVRITGTTDGIAWTVQQYEARGESDFPTVHWSSGGADARPIIIYVGDVQSVPALRGATGEWLLGLAERALAGHGVPIQQLRDFFARAEVVAFASAALGARYSALTTSHELAAPVLTPAVDAL
ncbi:MAG: hypothetical protein FJ399_02620, partial [Verrucomicrobia bacterium]|nr:hypothetical protein [Verrucomicrobiota bacterium]